MPLYKNRITDTSEIKNDVNGFDLVECYKQGKGKLYLCFPNLGAGMIAQTAASADPDTQAITPEVDYKYKAEPENPDGDYAAGKEIKFRPYSGMSREMFVTTMDTVTGCGNSASLGNTIRVCIPWKIYSTSDASAYLRTTEQSILTNDLKNISSDGDLVYFDYYVNMFKMALDVVKGTSGKAEELMDGIAASIIRYATAGMDILQYETDDEDNVTAWYPPETKWAKPYTVSIEDYTPMTERAEYSDLFTETRDYNQYLTKVAGGRTNLQIQDIFTAPCVLFGIEDGATNRLFYSKELSDTIMDNISIEGYTTPPTVEYQRVLTVYGYEGGDSPLYMNKIAIENAPDDLGISLDELDRLTGSGYSIKQKMIDMCEDTQSIQVLDWSPGLEYTGTLKDSEIVLTTPRPPVFSMGEAYMDREKIQPNGTMTARLPFFYSYIVPSLNNGYLQQQYLKETDFLGFQYYHGEGYDNLINATRDYLDLLKSLEESLLMQAPARYPVSYDQAIRLNAAKSWRLYTGTFATVTTGFVSGKPMGYNTADEVFIANINNGEIPVIEKVRDVTPVEKPTVPSYRPEEPIAPEKPIQPAEPIPPSLTVPVEPTEPTEGPNHAQYMEQMKQYDEDMLDYVMAKSAYDEAQNEYQAQAIIFQKAYEEWTQANIDYEIALAAYNDELAEYQSVLESVETEAKQYEQDRAEYEAYASKVGAANAAIAKYESLMYQYLGQCSHTDYDYTMYPVMVSDTPVRIMAQVNPETVSTKPDLGASLYKKEKDAYSSMSADATYVDIPASGLISVAKMFKSVTANDIFDEYLPDVPAMVNTARDTISKVKTLMYKYILDLDTGLAIGNDKFYPVFTNYQCCLTEAIEKPYIGSTLKSNLMYLSGDVFEAETLDELMDTMLGFWNGDSGALLGKISEYAAASKGRAVKLYADKVRTEVLEPTKLYCDAIADRIIDKDADGYYLYFKNEKGTISNTDSFREKYGYVVVTGQTQNLGCWFYNVRKIYLLLISMLSLIQTLVDALDNYMVAVLNDNVPRVLDPDPDDAQGNPVTAKFHSFAFMNGSSPVYPKLDVDIDIADIPPIYLNKVSALSAIPETFRYDMSINLEEMSSVDDSMAVVMPGFGIRNHTYITEEKHKYFWPDDSIYIITDDEDQDVLNSKFTALQNGISHDDFVTITDGNISFIDGSTGRPVQVTQETVEETIKSTKQTIPEIPEIEVKGVIDAGYVMPFFDKARQLKSNMKSADVLYEGMNPVYVKTDIDFTQFSGNNSDVAKKLTDEINSLINAQQYDPRTGFRKNRYVFKIPGTIEDQLKSVVTMMMSKILNKDKLPQLINPSNTDANINISVASHSFVRSGMGHTNNVTQAFLFDQTKLSAHMDNSESGMVSEIKGDTIVGDVPMWSDYNKASDYYAHLRNFNVYLSKRRSHYTSNILFLMILRACLAVNSVGEVTVTNDSFAIHMEKDSTTYKITFKVTGTPPGGTAFKLFSSYGFAGFFFDINLNNGARSTSEDIDFTIRSQIRVTDSLVNAKTISYTGYTSPGMEKDRIKYNIINTGSSTWSAPFPTNSLLFPANCIDVVASKEKTLKETYSQNKKELPKNYDASAIPTGGLYSEGNVKNAYDKAQDFVNKHIDAFQIDSFIDKLWIIIETV